MGMFRLAFGRCMAAFLASLSFPSERDPWESNLGPGILRRTAPQEPPANAIAGTGHI